MSGSLDDVCDCHEHQRARAARNQMEHVCKDLMAWAALPSADPNGRADFAAYILFAYSAAQDLIVEVFAAFDRRMPGTNVEGWVPDKVAEFERRVAILIAEVAERLEPQADDAAVMQ